MVYYSCKAKEKPFTEWMEEMKTPNAVETAVQYAIEAERLKMLIAAKDAKDLQEFIAYLEKLLKA